MAIKGGLVEWNAMNNLSVGERSKDGELEDVFINLLLVHYA